MHPKFLTNLYRIQNDRKSAIASSFAYIVQEHKGWTWNKIAESWFFQEWYMDISPDEFRRCPKNRPCAFF